MYVWVATNNGEATKHGGKRTTEARAKAVAKVLSKKLGWRCAAGETAPEFGAAVATDPSVAVAAHSPAF